MSQNIDEFSRACAVILGELYRCFPQPVVLNLERLQAKEDAHDSVAEGRLDRKLRRAALYAATVQVLIDERYVRCSGSIIEMTLTMKGLAAISRNPNFTALDMLRDI